MGLPTLATLIVLAGAPADGGAGGPPSPRPIDLFDGASLAGWQGDPRFWSVEDGAIVGRSTAEVPCSRNTYLLRDGVFDDFELRFEFSIEGGNSGVQYRSRDLGDFAVAGYQADLEAGQDYSGILYEEQGRGILAWRGERVRISADGVRTAAAELGDRAALQSAIRPGWNEYLVRAAGPRLIHEINGVRMVEVLDLSPEAARRGRIALQLHAGPPMTVRYRNLVLTPLAVTDDEASVAATAAPPAAPLAEEEVAWIWGPDPAAPGDELWFRRVIALDEPAVLEELVATCDDRFRAWLDGREVLAGDRWESPQVARNLGELAAGTHEIRVQASNEGGPAGLLLRARFRRADDSTFMVRSDEAWECAPVVLLPGEPPATREPTEWRAARSLGPSRAPQGPWPDPLARREATPAESIEVPPGYQVELVHSAQLGEGSWIAMGFDADGSLLISREQGPLMRGILPERRGGSIRLVEIPESPRGSMGFCSAFGALWVQGAGPQGYGLYRMRDADEDGVHEEVSLVAILGDAGEHGSHAVRLGPDGRLYILNGNHAPLPPSIAPTSPHARWAEDVLEPRVEDPRGHAVGVRAPGGHLLRMDLAGGEFEVLAAGLRNAYDFDFGPEGEILTFDSDMEWDLGLPWYRPTRVDHLVSGGEFGWRSGSTKWRNGLPDMVPPVAEVGLASPVGVLHGARLDFPVADREALYLGDWSYGRILRLRLEPEGATFRGTFDRFVTGRPLNVTDLEVGPDGALWFITGGRGTQSGLYRVDHDAAASLDDAPLPPMPGADERARRRGIESLHGRPDLAAASVDDLWTALADPDPAIRYAARVALEFAPTGGWAARALAEEDPEVALPAMLALVRAGDCREVLAAIDRLGAIEWDSLPPSARLAWLRLHEIALARHPDLASGDVAARLRARLEPLHPSGAVDLDRLLLALLVHLDSADAVAPAIASLGALDVMPAIDVAMALRLSSHLSAADREALFRWLGEARQVDGGHSLRGYLDAIERDALARAPEPARAALAALALPSPVEVPDLAAIAGGPQAWTMAKLEPYLPLASRDRDFASGLAAYRKAACASCHRFDGAGGGVGPDLTAASSRFSRRDLLRTMIDPSADVSDQYRNTRVALRSGAAVVGRIVQDDDRTVELVVDSFTGRTMRLPAASVVARESSPISPMPAGLLSTLSLEEVLDLLAYLESGGNPNHPAFAE